MPPRRRLDLQAKMDAGSETPGDLSFDRPTPDELIDIAWTMVSDLEACGFAPDEIDEVVERMATIRETRTGGTN